MGLFNQHWTSFDGTPITGKVPAKTVVHSFAPLNALQESGVAHAYKLFCDAVTVSSFPKGYHIQNRTLSDGSKIRMTSILGVHEVHVWLAGDEHGAKLPHGFAVVTNWRSPKIYKRATGTGAWSFASDVVPQVAVEDGITDNQVFRKPDGKHWLNLPMVFRKATRALWDYAVRKGPNLSPVGKIMPLRIKNSTTGAFTPFPAHFAADSKVYDRTGAVLYTVADAPGILLPAADGYPESVRHWPAQTDASGNELTLQHWRYAVISPTFNIWKFRLCNERLKRISDTEYASQERNTQDIITPWSKQTVGVTSISDNALGEDPDPMLYAVGMGAALGGAGYFQDINRFILFSTGWGEGAVNMATVPRRNSYLQSMRQIVEQEAGSATLAKIVAAGVHDEVAYIDILKELNYPAETLWRGGEAGIGYFTSDIFGDSFPGDGYGTSNAVIKRKDTKHYVDGVPKITAKLGWKDLLLLEGTTEGRMDGRVYENVETIYGKFANYMDDAVITRENYQTANPAAPNYVYGASTGDPGTIGTWLLAHNIRDTYFEDLRLEHGTGFSGPNPTTKNTTLENVRPTNTASYTLTSRYVIDYDHKGRFYAAIRCEVVSSGAEWEENTAVYEGFMQTKTDPSYNVKIWFESCWNGATTDLLLVEETVTRPAFEYITLSKFSPWYWPFPGYIDRDCKVRVPPEPTPNEEFMMMFNNLASHQGANTNLACADVRPDIGGADAALTQSKDGIEYSTLKDGRVIPHARYVTGQLYARTFKLSEIPEALWLLKQLKCDAVFENFQPPEPAPVRPPWHYHPLLKAALDVNRHIEVRDGVIGNWSDNLPGETGGYPPTPAAPPTALSREIKLYRV